MARCNPLAMGSVGKYVKVSVANALQGEFAHREWIDARGQNLADQLVSLRGGGW